MVVKCEVGGAVVEKEVVAESPGETYEYQAEVSRLMDLIVHSLYSHKEVFLRELVSNASDALDKLRFLSVTEPSILGDAGELEIRVKTDPDNGTITITDSGIGMTKEELIDCLGTIAQSGTSKFLKALKENKEAGADNSLIGQFGVGFYSAFLVAQKVEVSTKSPKSDKQYVWESVADSSSYVIREETNPDKLLRRGTQITLFLRDDDKYEFSEATRVLNLVKNYSQFVSFPIYVWQEKSRTIEVEEEEEPKEGEEQPEGEKKKTKKTKTEKYWDWELANETKPIWMRNPKEVEKDQYNEFYKKAFNEFLDPLSYTHFTTEGEVEFRSILYIPGMAPLNNEDVVNPKTKNIRLYVKRVFISEDFDGELFPRYLSFVRGVVDSDDLPLNVSREILQESRIDYKKFWENFANSQLRFQTKRITPLSEIFLQRLRKPLPGNDEDEVKERETKQEYILLCDWIKQQLGEKVAKVQVSKRLSSSPQSRFRKPLVWLIWKGLTIGSPHPDHPIIKDLNAACKIEPGSSEAKRAIELLYDTALISSGFTPDSPAELGGKIYEMMAMALGGRWGRSEEAETTEASEESATEVADVASTEDSQPEIIEASEVRPESDPWSE
ncbi:hypothetical protein Leryth_009977 [Lithospermum erythrorhizon]|nr:hypothetical protein Leryth_009977 [Lithospermum erythrorhizon]